MNRNVIYGLIALLIIGLGVAYVVNRTLANTDVSDAVNDRAANDTEAPDQGFRFSASQFPELRPVLQPESREEFLTPHESDTSFGDPQAPVTIIEFFSYACPHCKSFYEGPYQRIRADYVETGLVYFVKRDFLLNNQTVGFELLAGSGAQCLEGDAQKHAFASLVFEQQRNLVRADDVTQALIPIFGAVGMDETTGRTCMADQKNRSLVFGRAAQALQKAGVSGTPTIFINQKPYTGNAGNYADLREHIERALRAAQ